MPWIGDTGVRTAGAGSPWCFSGRHGLCEPRRGRVEQAAQHLLLPYLADAYVLTRQTVALGVRSDDEVAAIEVINGERLRRSPHPTSGRSPLHCTAMGKVLLAYAPDAVRRSLLGAHMSALTPATITSVGALAVELDRVRRRGLAVADGEYRPGVRSVAAPVFDMRGAVVAALGLAGPADDFPVQLMGQVVTRVARAASQALRTMCYASSPSTSGPPYGSWLPGLVNREAVGPPPIAPELGG